jgi:hypothetical protein
LQSKQVMLVVCHEDFFVHCALLPAILLVRVTWLRPCEGGKVLVVLVTNRYVVVCLIVTTVAAPLWHLCFDAQGDTLLDFFVPERQPLELFKLESLKEFVKHSAQQFYVHILNFLTFHSVVLQCRLLKD